MIGVGHGSAEFPNSVNGLNRSDSWAMVWRVFTRVVQFTKSFIASAQKQNITAFAKTTGEAQDAWPGRESSTKTLS